MSFPIPPTVFLVSDLPNGITISTNFDAERGLFNTVVFDASEGTIGKADTDVILADALRTHANLIDDHTDTEGMKRAVVPGEIPTD